MARPQPEAQYHEYDATHPLVSDKYRKQRSMFAPGLRIRMNVIPMFLNLFVPWGVFIFCCGFTSSYMHYTHPNGCWMLIAFMGVIWLGTVVVAMWARTNDPNPTWLTYLAFAVGAALIAGTICGNGNYTVYAEPYYKVQDLKVIQGVDASAVPGQNVMDAGMIYFSPGNHLDPLRSWHFMHKTLYCVAPIITNGSLPRGLSYDFWAVGKDCCSVTSSDFRCGAWGSVAAHGGWRVIDEEDQTFFRLAVQQAESLYNIKSRNPVFINWSINPGAEIAVWNAQAIQNFLMQAGFAFVFCLFFLTLATCRFACLGRGASTYQTEFYDDPEYYTGTYRQKAFAA